eukprot:5736477-Heterocapsa_arctica.AAC.1
MNIDNKEIMIDQFQRNIQALEELGHTNDKRKNRQRTEEDHAEKDLKQFKSAAERIEEEGSGTVIPAIDLIEEPDSVCRIPSERRVRGSAR